MVLKVGSHSGGIHDHLISGFVVGVNSSDSVVTRKLAAGNFMTVNPWNYFKFFTEGKGPLADSGISRGAFLHTKANKDPFKRPDIQFHTAPFAVDIDFGLAFKDLLNIDKKLYDDVYGPDLGG